jgi:hypothetical protein
MAYEKPCDASGRPRGRNVPDVVRELKSAEEELARLRGLVASIVAWINDPAHDGASRHALAQRLGLPSPRTTSRSREKQ